jgi:hypothetical protein
VSWLNELRTSQRSVIVGCAAFALATPVRYVIGSILRGALVLGLLAGLLTGTTFSAIAHEKTINGTAGNDAGSGPGSMCVSS